jgi:MFS family permease
MIPNVDREPASEGSSQASFAASSAYRNYLLSLLMIILAFNFIDRLALGVALQDIKTELSLSDTQLGVLSGIAFTLFYALMGIPLARWADRGNRVTIISVTAVLWSVAVALCGTAGSFVQLLLIRVGVAVGEAGCIPPAHSLIADYYSRTERPRALARYMLGAPISLTVGYFTAGWLNELYGWRTMFIALGLPGLALSLVAWLTIKEPRAVHRDFGRGVADRAGEPSLKEVCSTLWRNVAFRHLLFCFSVWLFFAYGLLQWQPTFFMRTHGLQSGQLGTWFGVIYGLIGIAGVYLGGELAARFAAHNERLQLIACAAAFAFFAVLSVCVYLAPNYHWAFAALALAVLGGNMAQGPIFATIQTLVPPRMRAMSIALVYFFANLIGMGLGPLAAGALSDALRPTFGEESLRYALMVLSPGYLWAAWHLWRASRTVTRDVAESQAHQGILKASAAGQPWQSARACKVATTSCGRQS